MLSKQTIIERVERAIRFDEIRIKRGLKIREFAELIHVSFGKVKKVCGGSGLSFGLLLQASQHLESDESDYIQFGDSENSQFIKVETNVTKYINEDYTEMEHEIIRMLRTMPKLRTKIFDNLKLKERLNLPHEQFIVTP